MGGVRRGGERHAGGKEYVRVRVHAHRVADRQVLVCRRCWGVRVLGEEVEPVLEVVLAAARHLHALALGACEGAGHEERAVY